jgi:hypothetical protein
MIASPFKDGKPKVAVKWHRPESIDRTGIAVVHFHPKMMDSPTGVVYKDFGRMRIDKHPTSPGHRFVDGAGRDAYKERWAGDGSLWISPKSDSLQPGPYEIGVGIDR